jgi:plastocyanin domain-containing protein
VLNEASHAEIPCAPARRHGSRFLRTTDKTCGTEVVFPTSNVKRALPLNEPVSIEFTPSKLATSRSRAG